MVPRATALLKPGFETSRIRGGREGKDARAALLLMSGGLLKLATYPLNSVKLLQLGFSSQADGRYVSAGDHSLQISARYLNG